MAHRVAWSRRALQDVEAIADYIAADSPTYAGSVVKKIVNQIRMLAKFPRAGRKVPEFDDENVRELVVYSYRLITVCRVMRCNRCGDSRQANADCNGRTRRQSVV
jgi:toxin ParE1/3/4